MIMHFSSSASPRSFQTELKSLIIIFKTMEGLFCMSKRYLIATSCDQKYENFLINHWLRSLKENSNLVDTDVLVMDFGLSDNAKAKLEAESIVLHRVESRNGHINNLRFLELRNYLNNKTNYEQVLLCDSGDMIFQSDISNVFKIYPEKIKGVCEEISPNMEIIVNDRNVRSSHEIQTFLKGKKLINAGFVVYPRVKFDEIVQKMFELVIDMNAWGVDMVLLNYIIYKHYADDFYELPLIYNFIPTTSTKKYIVKNGKFYLIDGTLILVVHNAGGKNFLRPIKNFGYGEGYNKPRVFIPQLLRIFYRTLKLARDKLRL